jgi:S1-C subfamily serine protease
LDASIQNGAIITRVDPLSDAYDMGLRNGHVITRVGSHRINNIGDFKDAMSSEEAARGVRVWVKKQNGSGFPMVLKAPL